MLETAIRRLYAGVNEPVLWEAGLNALADATSADQILLPEVDLISDGRAPKVTRMESARADPGLLQRLLDWFVDSPQEILRFLNPVGYQTGRWLNADLERLATTEFIETILRPIEARHCILGMPLCDQESVTVVALNRSARRGHFSQQGLANFSTLQKHLTNAVQIRRQLEKAPDNSLSKAIIDDVPSGIFLLDRRLNIIAMNRHAEGLLKQGDGLIEAQGRLQVAAASCRPAFQAALLKAATKTASASDADFFRLPRPPEGRPLTVRILPVEEGYYRCHWPSSAVTVWVDIPKADVEEQQIRHLFEFTKRETRLASLIMRGVAPERCAQQMNVSTETVRTHLGTLFSKTGTHGQTELVGKLLRISQRI